MDFLTLLLSGSSVGEVAAKYGQSFLFVAYLLWEGGRCREDRKHFMEFIEGMVQRSESKPQEREDFMAYIKRAARNSNDLP